jgi:hypothetical protein
MRAADGAAVACRYDGLLAKVFKRRRKQDYLGKKPWFEVV